MIIVEPKIENKISQLYFNVVNYFLFFFVFFSSEKKTSTQLVNDIHSFIHLFVCFIVMFFIINVVIVFVITSEKVKCTTCTIKIITTNERTNKQREKNESIQSTIEINQDSRYKCIEII
mgnify:CR=1 FL=1